MTQPGIRNTLCLVDKDCLQGLDHEPNLSIELMPDGFVFAVMNPSFFQYCALEKHLWGIPPGQPGWKEEFGHFWEHHPILSQHFARIFMACYSPGLVIVPEDLYDADADQSLYSFCAPPPKSSSMHIDRLNNLSSRGLYYIHDDLTAFFKGVDAGVKISHHGSVLIESTLAAITLKQWDADLVVHVRKTHCDIILLEKGSLIHFSTHQTASVEDLYYYVFYVLNQLGRESSQLRVAVLGEMGLDTPGYDVFYAYFREVIFPPRNDMYLYAPVFDALPHHLYFNLLNLNSCG